MKWKLLFAVLLGLLMVGMTAESASAGDVFSVNFSHKRGKVVYGGLEDYFYCSWKFLSGQPYDAWGIRMYYVPGKYLTILDHWGRGGVSYPQTYKWFVKESIRAGDSSPYDHYFNLPAPWLKVRYNYIEGTNRVTYRCALDLFIKAIPIFDIPIYIKRKTVIDSFEVFIVGPPRSSPNTFRSEPSFDHKVDHIVFPLPDMRQVKKSLMEILIRGGSRPDFVVVEVRKIGNTEVLTITGYKEEEDHGEARVIFEYSKNIVPAKEMGWS
ncbi:hypothetical protein E3E26_09775 [Thermococcus sp. LS1]|nr:hypothetical protein [Thermococcus sp. LS1]